MGTGSVHSRDNETGIWHDNLSFLSLERLDWLDWERHEGCCLCLGL